VAINKADGDHERAAASAARELAGALRLLRTSDAPWTTPVLTCSALTSAGLDEVRKRINDHRAAMRAAGEFDRNRSRQQVDWTWTMVRDALSSRLHDDPAVRALVPDVERQVRAGTLTATLAAERILAAFGMPPNPPAPPGP
ncbi:MAG TPA: methylmalonyl Co-A mutase-associated GTPase MeaB, partial [Pseudonocardiaceae bacterium]